MCSVQKMSYYVESQLLLKQKTEIDKKSSDRDDKTAIQSKEVESCESKKKMKSYLPASIKMHSLRIGYI
jgi:hypothetical protein